MNPRRRSALLGVAGAVLLGGCTSAGGTALPEDGVSITTAAASTSPPTTAAAPSTTTTIPPTTTTTIPAVVVASLSGAWQSPELAEGEQTSFVATATAADTVQDQWDEFAFEWMDESGDTHSFAIKEPMEISGVPTLEVYAAAVATGRATIGGESSAAKALVSIAPTEVGTLLITGQLFTDPSIPFSFELAPQP